MTAFQSTLRIILCFSACFSAYEVVHGMDGLQLTDHQRQIVQGLLSEDPDRFNLAKQQALGIGPSGTIVFVKVLETSLEESAAYLFAVQSLLATKNLDDQLRKMYDKVNSLGRSRIRLYLYSQYGNDLAGYLSALKDDIIGVREIAARNISSLDYSRDGMISLITLLQESNTTAERNVAYDAVVAYRGVVTQRLDICDADLRSISATHQDDEIRDICLALLLEKNTFPLRADKQAVSDRVSLLSHDSDLIRYMGVRMLWYKHPQHPHWYEILRENVPNDTIEVLVLELSNRLEDESHFVRIAAIKQLTGIVICTKHDSDALLVAAKKRLSDSNADVRTQAEALVRFIKESKTSDDQ